MVISYSDIYKGLWKCRDFELEHYWHRAVFLSAFLLACYAGYGAFILEVATTGTLRLSFTLVNALASGICLIGLTLSLLWIMMAKGSKAWYEHYESAISAFVARYKDDCKVFDGDLSKLAGFGIGDIEEFEPVERSSWIWDTKSGPYSVSKINIALGHISSLICVGLILIHLLIAQHEVSTFQEAIIYLESLITPFKLMLSISFTLLLFWVYSKIFLKSSYFDNN